MKSKKNARRGESGAIPAISKRIFEIDLSERFRAKVRPLPKATRRDIARVIDSMRDALGQPHLHTGLGIRKLHRDYFECRAGINLRLVFRVEPLLVTFIFAGTHDEVR